MTSPQSLKIMMLAPTPYFADRGCHVRIYEEARALITLGCDVRIVTYHIGRDMDGIPTYRIPQIPWYQRLTAGPSWQKPFLDLLLLYKAYRVADSFKPDIIHAHLHEGAFVGLLLKPLTGTPLVMDFQGSLTTECRDHGFFKPGSFLDKIFSGIEGFINRKADAIITSSTAGCTALKQEWSVPAGKVASVIDGVDTEQFRAYPRHEARKRLGIAVDDRLVVFLGVLNAYQGIDLLLEAVALLKTQESNIHFLVMGYPDELYRIKASEMGLADLITFTGRIDYKEAAFLLSAGDLAVSPKLSLSEANGKLFNYMACGLPTLVFDTPVNREILGDAGVYAEYGNVAELAKNIVELLSDEKRLSELSGAVREKAVHEHSWISRAAGVKSIYLNLLLKTNNKKLC